MIILFVIDYLLVATKPNILVEGTLLNTNTSNAVSNHSEGNDTPAIVNLEIPAIKNVTPPLSDSLMSTNPGLYIFFYTYTNCSYNYT